jgi:hypothetical protein
MHRSFTKPLEPSRIAAALLGPSARMPSGLELVPQPTHKLRIGADDREVDLLFFGEQRPASKSVAAMGTHSATSAMPALPGAQ